MLESTHPFPRHRILWLSVHAVTGEETLRFARERIASGRPARIVTVNTEFVMLARDDAAFRGVVETADLATPDSAGILWALSRQGIHLDRRVGGSDLIWTLSEQAARCGHSVFLLGGLPGVAERAAAVLRSTYPALRVAGTYAGSPSPSEEGEISRLIRASEADILFVAFGAPQQDLWIARNLAATGARIGLGVGGSLDYVAGTARRAPVWMQERGLEWLWRLLRQPWRWRRMLALPRFAWLVLTSQEHAGERTMSD